MALFSNFSGEAWACPEPRPVNVCGKNVIVRDTCSFFLFFSKPTGLLRGHTAPIFHLFICPEDDRIFSVSTDKTVKVCRPTEENRLMKGQDSVECLRLVVPRQDFKMSTTILFCLLINPRLRSKDSESIHGQSKCSKLITQFAVVFWYSLKGSCSCTS